MFENLTGDQNMDENDENLPSTSSQKSQEENSAGIQSLSYGFLFCEQLTCYFFNHFQNLMQK